ncbi:MAG: tetratricopeptide repeat protein [Bryobacterales bacterium]|nr:tetratricopeptide repeat protein [Acidobacteriota bacterium]MCB9384879.1 tetratricopeptide repeat protein [Bryobacterales bacterium]
MLSRNDGSYARRAFERRSLQETVANTRKILDNTERILEKDRLPIVQPQTPRPFDPARPLEILRAENRAIPLVGRRSDLDGLHVWLRSPDMVSVRIFTGRAGAGKTRLGYQFLLDLQQLRQDGRTEWDSGLLRGSGLEDLQRKHWDAPTVAVIDYAAAVAPVIVKWLSHLVDHPPKRKLRLLLLEREAHADSGWLRLILEQSGPSINHLLDPPAPLPVAPIDDSQLRRSILSSTLEALGSPIQTPTTGEDHALDEGLAEDRWRDPLYLMMAAFVANETGGLVGALSYSRTDLAEQLADHEIRRIRRFSPNDSSDSYCDLLVRLAGIITACQATDLTLDTLIQISKEEAEPLGAGEFPGGPREAAKRIASALAAPPAVGARHAVPSPAPIEPDIVGEAVMLRTFVDTEGTEALVRAARRLDRRYASKVCESITRTCQDFASEEQQQPLDWVEAIIQHGIAGDVTLLTELEGAMPHQTLVLRERAAAVDELILQALTAISEKSDNPALDAERGRIANNLSVRLSDLGRREDALAQAEEAVRIRRALAQQRPDAFLPDLAMSLNNLATMLSDLGRREDALAQAEEAVRIRRALAQQRPDAFLPDLAMSLNNLANMLRDLGRREDALAQAEEAVRIRRALAQKRPDAFLPDLATSLGLIGHIQMAEDPAAALPFFEEAISVLTPFFTRFPLAHVGLMQGMCLEYLQACQANESEPNQEILDPVLEVFQKLQPPDEPPES